MCCGIAGGLKGAAPSQASEVCHEVISLQVACISPEVLIKSMEWDQSRA